jgi:protein TonB
VQQSRREERPAVAPRREEKPAVAPVKPAPKEEQRPAPPAVAKREEPQAATPVAEPAAKEPAPKAAAVAAAPAAEPAEPAAEEKPSRSFLANPLVWVFVAVLVIAVGVFFYFRSSRMPAQQAATDSGLALKVERSAGQLVLSWNRNAPTIATAGRATLSISDGEYKEDAQLDLGALRSGSIVYSPITNDVSFKLEVADTKTGKSLSETVRAIAGRPSPMAPQNAAAPAPSTDKPATQVAAATPSAPAAATPVPPAPKVEQPTVSAAPAVTAAPPKPESLSARLRPAEVRLPEPPALDSQPAAVGQGPAVPAANLATPPPPVAAKPAAGAPVNTPAPAPAQQQQQTAPLPAQAAPRVGGNVQEAVAINQPTPVYPPLARQSRVAGIVRVEANIGKDGRVKRANAISGPPLLRKAAADAVSKWIYQPKKLNGEAVEATVQVDVNFALR